MHMLSVIFIPQPLDMTVAGLWHRAWNQIYNSIVTAFFPNGTLPTRQAILAENELANKQTSDADPYDQ